MTFSEMLENTLKHEGGYSDKEKDRGRETKYGITKKTLSVYLGREITSDTVKNLTLDMAKEIYKKLYYEAPRINMLPEAVQPIIFDAGVNMGTVSAIRLAQKVFTKMGTPITCDGVIGPKTLVSAKTALNVYNYDVIIALVNARINFYETLVIHDPEQKDYLKGWTIRARSYL